MDRMFSPEQIKRILIIRLAPLGETVLTTPVIRALRQHFRDAYIAYMVAPTREDLVSANPHLNEVLTYQASVPKLTYQMAQGKFQMAVVLQPTFRLVLHTFLARIPFRVGFETNAAGKKLLSLAVSNNTAQHETQRYLDVVRALGIEVTDDEPEVFVDSASTTWVNNFLENQKLNDSSPIIGLNPGAATAYRRWDTSNFAILGDWLHETYGAHIAITTDRGKVSWQTKWRNRCRIHLLLLIKQPRCNLRHSCSGAIYTSATIQVRCTSAPPSKHQPLPCSVRQTSFSGLHRGTSMQWLHAKRVRL